MKEDLRKIRQARQTIETLIDQIPGSVDVEMRRIEEALKTRNQRMKARVDEAFAHVPHPIESVNDIEFKERRIVPQSIRRVIRKWDDGYGNEIFTAGEATRVEDFKAIHELGVRIDAQREAFEGLSDELASQVLEDFDSGGRVEITKLYSDFLRSEALGRKFRELRQNPPNPFGKK